MVQLDLLKWVQRTVMKLIRVLEHLSDEDGLRDLELFIMEKRRLTGNLTVVPSVPKGSLQEKLKRNILQGHLVTG